MSPDYFLLFKDVFVVFESRSTEFSESSQRWLHCQAMLTSLVNLTYCSHQYTVITNKSENRTWGLVNHLILARGTLLENTFHIIQRQKLGGIISKWQSHKQTHTTRGPKFTNSCYQNLPFRSLTPHMVRGNRYSNTKVDGSITDRLGLYIKMKNVLILWPRIPTYRN